MLTPQEVSERAFQKATFNGYNMSQVDEFLDILTADYSALYSENAVLKSKMKVLADKVEEYRATEDAMRQAFMIAQRRADDLVREAEQKRAALIHEAEGEARQRMESITRRWRRRSSGFSRPRTPPPPLWISCGPSTPSRRNFWTNWARCVPTPSPSRPLIRWRKRCPR